MHLKSKALRVIAFEVLDIYGFWWYNYLGYMC